MSWLKKFGQIAASIAGIAQVSEPIVRILSPQTEDIFHKVVSAVATTEVIFNAIGQGDKGSDKLKAATPLVAQIIQTSQAISGKKIKNQAAFTKAVEGITSNVADLLNALEAE